MSQATMTTKGQITIPAEVRKSLNLNAGDKVVFITRESGEVVIFPAIRDINSIKGMVQKPTEPFSQDAMDAAIKDHHCKQSVLPGSAKIPVRFS